MYSFALSSEQKRLVAAFREFGESVFLPERVFQWKRDQGLPDEVVKGFTDLYFSFESSTVGKSFAHSVMSQTLILEELSRCAGATLPFQNDLFNLQIMNWFAESSRFSDALDFYRKTGRLMFSFAISEPVAGSDTMGMHTYTQTVDGKIILNGQKNYVNNGEYSPNILVAAIDKDVQDPGKYPALAFWLIPRTLKGVRAYPINKIGQSMLPFASLAFDDVELLPEYRLSGNEGGFQQLFRLLEFGRVFICASSVGMAQAAMEDAVAHARERIAFGKHISQFQQIEQMLTDMEVSLTSMRLMLYRAVWDIENDTPDKRLSVALMKRFIPKTATEVASNAMQILGGLGYTEGSRVSSIWEDCRGNQIGPRNRPDHGLHFSPAHSRQIRKGRSSMKTSTKYWIYALVINPITTLIIYYMFNAGFNLLNLIGVGIIGYGIFLYFVVQAIRIDVRARQAYKKKKGKGGKKKKKR